MKKNMITTILATIMAFSSLALGGCGGGDKDVVRIARWGGETDKVKFQAWTQEFMAENPDIKVEWEFKDFSTHFSTLRNDLIGESAADIIFLNNWGLTRLNLQEKDKAMFVDLAKVDAFQRRVTVKGILRYIVCITHVHVLDLVPIGIPGIAGGIAEDGVGIAVRTEGGGFLARDIVGHL